MHLIYWLIEKQTLIMSSVTRFRPQDGKEATMDMNVFFKFMRL